MNLKFPMYDINYGLHRVLKVFVLLPKIIGENREILNKV